MRRVSIGGRVDTTTQLQGVDAGTMHADAQGVVGARRGQNLTTSANHEKMLSNRADAGQSMYGAEGTQVW